MMILIAEIYAAIAVLCFVTTYDEVNSAIRCATLAALWPVYLAAFGLFPLD